MNGLLKSNDFTLEDINWPKIRAVIFDVDGTLYDQKKLRRSMVAVLLKAGLRGPRMWQEIRIITRFRKEREKWALTDVSDLENSQYRWAAKSLGVSPQRVREVVDKWMYRVPLQYLFGCRYSEAEVFIRELRSRGVITAVFSDYSSKDKLKALQINSDFIFSATDIDIDRLKPDPRGLLLITGKLNLKPHECLFIGDRDDRDGECARRAGMPYLILPRGAGNCFFRTLTDSLKRQYSGK